MKPPSCEAEFVTLCGNCVASTDVGRVEQLSVAVIIGRCCLCGMRKEGFDRKLVQYRKADVDKDAPILATQLRAAERKPLKL